MTYENLLAQYRQIGGEVGTDEQNNAFNEWTTKIAQTLGVSGWESIPDDAFSAGLVDSEFPDSIPPSLLDGLIARADQGDQAAIDELIAGGYELADAPTESQPLEQALLNQVLPGLLEDVSNDANRALMADAQGAIAQGDYDLARQIIQQATSGQQLQTELGTADTAAASKVAALDDALAKLSAAQGPLSEARLASAEGQVTGVNLGLERTLDQLDAERALQGFVGGSTADTAAAARATVGARQRGANLVGDARVLNATDDRSLAGFGATEGYSIANSLADQKQQLEDADFGRSLQAAFTLPQLQNQLISTTGNIENQRNAGLRRTQGALDWWATAPQRAPTANFTPVQASTVGSDIAGLGANLASAGISIGNTNDWWKTPKTPAASFTPPASTVLGVV